MRHLISIIFALVFIMDLHAQSVVTVPQGSVNTRRQDKGGSGFDQYIGLPRLDSSGWGTSGLHSDLFIRKHTDSLLYRWNPKTKVDEPVGGTGFNIYNRSDTLLSDRTIYSGGKNFSIKGDPIKNALNNFTTDKFYTITLSADTFLFLKGGNYSGLSIYNPGVGIHGNSPGAFWKSFLRTTALTANRLVEFQDKSGTIAFLDDLPIVKQGTGITVTQSGNEYTVNATGGSGSGAQGARENFTGSGTAYTVANTPIEKTAVITVNGVVVDYTETGSTYNIIDLGFTLTGTDIIRIQYLY